MSDFKVGDVVILKCLGPKMVVTGISQSDGELYCQWFVDNAEPKGHYFPPAAVKKIPDAI